MLSVPRGQRKLGGYQAALLAIDIGGLQAPLLMCCKSHSLFRGRMTDIEHCEAGKSYIRLQGPLWCLPHIQTRVPLSADFIPLSSAVCHFPPVVHDGFYSFYSMCIHKGLSLACGTVCSYWCLLPSILKDNPASSCILISVQLCN